MLAITIYLFPLKGCYKHHYNHYILMSTALLSIIFLDDIYRIVACVRFNMKLITGFYWLYSPFLLPEKRRDGGYFEDNLFKVGLFGSLFFGDLIVFEDYKTSIILDDNSFIIYWFVSSIYSTVVVPLIWSQVCRLF